MNTTKSWLQTALALGLIVIIFFMGTVLYAIRIEPARLSVTRHSVYSGKVPEAFSGTKIVQFSDTHIGPDFTLQQLKKAVALINGEKPGIVVFTGDLFDSMGRYGAGREQISSVLAEIHAPLGKFAVYGNHDRGGGGSPFFAPLMQRAGFRVLVNEAYRMKGPGGKAMTITGLDDYLLGRPDEKKALSSLNKEEFNLLLVHEPDVADRLLPYPVDLQLSGHSHGGQVRLPVLDAPVKTRLAEKYESGMYEIGETGDSRLLYVNRGAGTTRMRIRLGSEPELSVFTLSRKPGSPS
ncbi:MULTISPECIES: metallophosphoesterase [unclassified Paenibacillus]|uniref:metallophosphoesterase n=1 Tax=unclassified Paenibacillus TaxID=185978 RepID=UPI00020D7A08|nr:MULTISPECIES: metallophosphoesterase [unclassified Paenibacillus]EGL19192.1 Ser/Thr phosphatase family protein [Paenibacillus sp. HGF7]EPD81205.1 hypothetical protein HMPREF1207_04962 [Paenibacillus sp. HGH0039]